MAREVEELRVRTRAFIDANVLPFEADLENYSEQENISLERLAPVQGKVKKRPAGRDFRSWSAGNRV